MSYCHRWLILPLILMEHEIDGQVFFCFFFIRLVIAHRVAFFKWGWIENKSNHEKKIDHCTCIVTSRTKGKLMCYKKHRWVRASEANRSRSYAFDGIFFFHLSFFPFNFSCLFSSWWRLDYEHAYKVESAFTIRASLSVLWLGVIMPSLC